MAFLTSTNVICWKEKFKELQNDAVQVSRLLAKLVTFSDHLKRFKEGFKISVKIIVEN